jgi:hypothetical protein
MQLKKLFSDVVGAQGVLKRQKELRFHRFFLPISKTWDAFVSTASKNLHFNATLLQPFAEFIPEGFGVVAV